MRRKESPKLGSRLQKGKRSRYNLCGRKRGKSPHGEKTLRVPNRSLQCMSTGQRRQPVGMCGGIEGSVWMS
ncbi:hypothetical protein PhCBS80983_g05187 [Powellomyces hirtus]|uniref:Uncharacterized protein n=1 Tax=Powellomyces hirtus TaxID=109895 RepID=A0A507DWC7_9FUNG|nr:hypothetical protein PhCBS80983_g05187 [Powellomyces hirtus]